MSSKRQISLNFGYHVNFKLKIFIPHFACVLTNERYKTYQTGFSFCQLGHVPEVGLFGAGGAQGVQSFIFFTLGHVTHQIDGDDEQSQTGDLGVNSKAQI